MNTKRKDRDAKDAARYRWLRDQDLIDEKRLEDLVSRVFTNLDDMVDTAIEAEE